jgi:hypothetical protein
MNNELLSFKSKLLEDGYVEKTYTELSANMTTSLVTDDNIAFNFDEMSHRQWGHNLLTSADALLIKDSLYLIEFKTYPTSSNPKRNKSDTLFKSFKSKMAESHISLKTKIFPKYNIDDSKFKTIFIYVINKEVSSLMLLMSFAAKLNKAKDNNQELSQLHIASNIYSYNSENLKVFYDEVQIWDCSEFSLRLSYLK